MTGKDDDSTAKDIVDMINTVSDIVEENKEIVDKVAEVTGMSEDKNTVSIAEMDELSEMRSMKDKIEIVAETKMDGVGTIGITKEEDKIEIDLGEKTIVANDIPEGADVSQANASLNNGVMTVVIPRDVGIGSSVDEKEGDL